MRFYEMLEEEREGSRQNTSNNNFWKKVAVGACLFIPIVAVATAVTTDFIVRSTDPKNANDVGSGGEMTLYSGQNNYTCNLLSSGCLIYSSFFVALGKWTCVQLISDKTTQAEFINLTAPLIKKGCIDAHLNTSLCVKYDDDYMLALTVGSCEIGRRGNFTIFGESNFNNTNATNFNFTDQVLVSGIANS